MRKIITRIDDATLEETAQGLDTNLPYRAAFCDMCASPERVCPWHWHPDVEVFYMTSGELTYRVPGRSCVFHKGDIGFVNANVLHMTEALGDPPCVQQEHIFLPRLIGGLPGAAIDRKYVQPLIENRTADLLRIGADEPGAAHLRETLDAAFYLFESGVPGRELRIRSCLSEVWVEIFTRMPEDTQQGSVDASRVKAMISFMEAHYAEPVTLEEIVSAAQIGVREGSRCFRRQIGTTIFGYLLDLRIERACELLRRSDLPVTGIALMCGFSAPSYFGKIFRRKLKLSPSEYRRAGRPDTPEREHRE